MKQEAFTTALIVAYARPFTKGIGWPLFPLKLCDYDAEEKAIHSNLISKRHSIYAHSDAQSHPVIPVNIGGYPSFIGKQYANYLPRSCLEAIQSMVEKTQSNIQRELKVLLRSVT